MIELSLQTGSDDKTKGLSRMADTVLSPSPDFLRGAWFFALTSYLKEPLIKS